MKRISKFVFKLSGGGEIRTRVEVKLPQGFRDLAVQPLLHPTLVHLGGIEPPISWSATKCSIR